MRVLPLLICVVLSACATRWVNKANPGADEAADLTICEKDAERAMRLDRLITQPSSGNCESRFCVEQAADKSIQLTARVDLAKKRCMAARGWQQQY